MHFARMLLLLLAPAVALADPDDYDPLLDQPPRPGPGARSAPDPRAPGFMVGGFGGGYFGSIKSYLTRERSMLIGGSRPFVGFGFGVRTPSPIELGIDLGLGLGRTWSSKYSLEIAAFDVIIQPRLLVHVYEPMPFGLYVGAAGEAVLFDVESAGLSQAGIGPAAVAGALYRLGQHSFIFVEGTATAFYDALAWYYRYPSDEALAEDPTLTREKVEGAWYGIGRITVGYRLTAF